MDQKAVEWGKGMASNAEKLEQECSNKVQRLQELEFVSEALEQKNQSLEQELARCRERRNELEKLLDESALEVNKIQKRHEEKLEEMQGQLDHGRQKELDHGRQKVLDENKKLRETVQEQKRVLSDLESELRQERNMACLPKPGDWLRMVKQRDNALHSLQICQQGKHLSVAAKPPVFGGC